MVFELDNMAFIKVLDFAMFLWGCSFLTIEDDEKAALFLKSYNSMIRLFPDDDDDDEDEREGFKVERSFIDTIVSDTLEDPDLIFFC